MMKFPALLLLISGLFACVSNQNEKRIIKKINSNEYFQFVKTKALEIVKTGFNAGDGYGEVWIRDYNTFIELSAEVYPHENLTENLRVFFRLQDNDENIIDGFIPYVYFLEGSPLPPAFNENEILYHGGIAVAIEAGCSVKINLEFL